MVSVLLNGEMYEVEPAVKVIIDKLMIENAELKKENARLEEGYQKSLGVIAADSLPTSVDLYKLKMMCLNHTVCETCEYIGDFGQCGLRGKPEDWSLGGAECQK